MKAAATAGAVLRCPLTPTPLPQGARGRPSLPLCGWAGWFAWPRGLTRRGRCVMRNHLSSDWAEGGGARLRIRRAAGPRPASEEGKPELTTAPRSNDHGDENSGRLPLRTAVEGVPQEAVKQVVPPRSVHTKTPAITRRPLLSTPGRYRNARRGPGRPAFLPPRSHRHGPLLRAPDP